MNFRFQYFFPVFCLILFSCKTPEARPDWIEKPDQHKESKALLLLLGSAQGESSDQIRPGVEENLKTKYQEFINNVYKNIFNSFRIKLGELHDSKNFVAIVENPQLQKEISDKTMAMVAAKEEFYSKEEKKFYLLMGLEESLVIAKSQQILLEKIQKSDMSSISMDKATEILNAILAKENKRLREDFSLWKNKQ